MMVHSLDIPLGTTFSCSLKNNTKFETQLVGYEHDNFFLLKFPTVTGIDSYLTRDAHLAALFQTSGYTITFASIITIPIPRRFLAFCKYPANFKVSEIRNTKRIDCLIPTGGTVLGGNTRFVGVIQDISLAGCRLILEGIHGTLLRKLEVGNRLELEAWTQKDTLNIEAAVVRVQHNISRVVLGLSFNGLSKQDTSIIESFIYSMQYTGTSSS